jgi:hypothetical protein
MPVSDATQEDLIRKKAAFEGMKLHSQFVAMANISVAFLGTTHWPNAMHSGSNVAKRNGVPDPHNRDRPVTLPVLDEKGFKLTGIPYIKA